MSASFWRAGCWLLAALAGAPANAAPAEFNVRAFHAAGDGMALDTPALQGALDACAAAGGGRVVLPPGTYLSGTLHLRDNVELHLDQGARLLGTTNLAGYEPFAGVRESPRVPRDNWHRGLILGEGVTNLTLSGPGVIDGQNVFDPRGEEHMRGPHLILLAHCQNVNLRDLTLQHAGNYALLYFHSDQVSVANVTFLGGSDGVHFRGTPEHWNQGLSLTHCRFFTGDDGIAGHYLAGARITDCTINSSCNGIRVIGPVRDFEVGGCEFFGPGKYEHRVSHRTNMLAAICLQPGAWTPAPGFTDDVRLHDLTMKAVTTPLHVSLRPGGTAGRLRIEHLRATGVYRAPLSVESWGEPTFEDVALRDVQVEFTGGGTTADAALAIRKPGADARPLPVWGLYLRGVKHLALDHVTLTTLAPDARPPFVAEDVGRLEQQATRFAAAP